jgi:hypothetical protein
MDPSDALLIVDETESHIEEQFNKDHKVQLHLINGAIALLLNGIVLLGKYEVDTKNIEDYVLRRYLFGIPFQSLLDSKNAQPRRLIISICDS